MKSIFKINIAVLIFAIATVCIFSLSRTSQPFRLASSSNTIDQSLVPLIVASPVASAQLDAEGNGNSIQPVTVEPSRPLAGPVNPPIMIYGNQGLIVSSRVPGFWKVWYDTSDRTVYSASIVDFSSEYNASKAFGQLESSFKNSLAQYVEPAQLQSSQLYIVPSLQTGYGFEATATLATNGQSIPLVLYGDLTYCNNVGNLTTMLTVGATSSSSVPITTFNNFAVAQYNLLNSKLNGPSNPLGSSSGSSSTANLIIGVISLVFLGSVIFAGVAASKRKKLGRANAQMYSGNGSMPGAYIPQNSVNSPYGSYQPYNPYPNRAPQSQTFQQQSGNQPLQNYGSGISAGNMPGNYENTSYADQQQVQNQNQTVSNLPEADWYKDPEAPPGSERLRYWDGTNWTEHYHEPGNQ